MSTRCIGVRALAAAVVLLCSLPALAGDEIGGDPGAPGPEWPEIHDLDARLNASFGRMMITDPDAGVQYDGVWLGGLELSAAMTRESRFFVSVHHGSTTGDPYAGDPTFEGDGLDLRTTPIRVGLRLDSSANPAFRVYWTAAWQMAHVSEESPTLGGGDATGWATGIHLAVAPEIPFGDGDRAVRLEVGWSGFGGEIVSDGRQYDLSLSGAWMALGATFGL